MYYRTTVLEAKIQWSSLPEIAFPSRPSRRWSHEMKLWHDLLTYTPTELVLEYVHLNTGVMTKRRETEERKIRWNDGWWSPKTLTWRLDWLWDPPSEVQGVWTRRKTTTLLRHKVSKSALSSSYPGSVDEMNSRLIRSIMAMSRNGVKNNSGTSVRESVG